MRPRLSDVPLKHSDFHKERILDYLSIIINATVSQIFLAKEKKKSINMRCKPLIYKLLVQSLKQFISPNKKY